VRPLIRHFFISDAHNFVPINFMANALVNKNKIMRGADLLALVKCAFCVCEIAVQFELYQFAHIISLESIK
jgi:hypothetical protein